MVINPGIQHCPVRNITDNDRQVFRTIRIGQMRGNRQGNEITFQPYRRTHRYGRHIRNACDIYM